ncbi:hypothetical protein KAR91_30500 [Candidatus Pacearchaeota archaeon]|nr:hypothetical protein [Candidatus Pacearchaeota archaeon]
MSKKKASVQTYVRMTADMQQQVAQIMKREGRLSLSNTITSIIHRWLQAQKQSPN